MPMSQAARSRLLGTSANPKAPWETYDQDMDPFVGCPDHLRAQVAEYARRRHAKPSTQNLEELCRQQELSTNMSKEFRFENQNELSGEGPDRIGRVMNCVEFWEKLQTIIPAYLASTIRKGLSGLAVFKDGEWKYVCAMQVGFNHEYSTLWFDSHCVPLNSKWVGWRGTVLLRLITGGFISEQKAHEVFGEPVGSAGRAYREQLFRYRNRQEK